MNVVYKGLGMIKHYYNQLNPATLTGAIDIVVIEQEDGTLLASPFHVRFGKLGVIRAKEKLVKITVNDERIPDLHMKLGDQGEAFFVQEIIEEKNIPYCMMTSPIPSRPDTPIDKESKNFDKLNLENEEESGKRKRRKKRKKRAIVSSNPDDGLESIASLTASESEDDDVQTKEGVQDVGKPNTIIDRQETNMRGPLEKLNDDGQATVCGFLSDSEILPVEDEEMTNPNDVTITPYSDSETTAHSSRSGMMWGWGELPASNDNNSRESDDSGSSYEDKSNNDHFVESRTERSMPNPSSEKRFMNDLPIEVTSEPILSEVHVDNAPPPAISSKPPTALNGLYLDDVLSLTPTEANLYLKQQPLIKPLKDASTSTSPPTIRPNSPAACSDVDSGTDSQTHDEATSHDALLESVLPESRISLCGFTSGTSSVDEAKFREKEVSLEAFFESPTGILNHPSLVVKLGDRYMNWQTAAPALIAMVIFKQPLSKDCVDRLSQANAEPQQSKGLASWFGWKKSKPSSRDNLASLDVDKPSSSDLRRESLGKSFSDSQKTDDGRKIPTNGDDEREVAEIMTQSAPRLHPIDNSNVTANQTSHNQFVFTSTTTISGGRLMKKTTRLTSKQLISLGLKEGANKIVFSVTTQYQGTSRCQATIYLWKWSDKLVVSDIDGTITKSDVFGQIFPVVGKDWTQSGVAKLYQNIGKNGYKFMYLSARAIGQASMTKGYLNWINQQGVSLPPGPLFLSPTSLMIAFRREVIEKRPEKFKIDCLTDIKALFPAHINPFSAGFGNKTSDVIAYRAVGIPNSRMFTINHKGELRQEQLQTYKTSYLDLGESVDSFFPPLEQKITLDLHSHFYSDFSFWRDDITLEQYTDFDYLP